MKVGQQIPVGAMTVEKLSESLWAVRTPDGYWHTVEETGDGYEGLNFAIQAVYDAEQACDQPAAA